MKDAELVAENLYRVLEFRQWVRSNVLFPEVSDNLVKPGVEAIRAWENALVSELYQRGEVERVVAIQKRLQPAPRTPVT